MATALRILAGLVAGVLVASLLFVVVDWVYALYSGATVVDTVYKWTIAITLALMLALCTLCYLWARRLAFALGKALQTITIAASVSGLGLLGFAEYVVSTFRLQF